MNEQSPFDAIAADYDKNFSDSLIGREQRQLTHRWLKRILEGKKLRILEINCGTGEDALWLSSLGHTVVATDQSKAMISEAERKIGRSVQKNIQFISCGFEKLTDNVDQQQFDLIFSNFSGLNCVSPHEMKLLGKQLFSLLKDNGHLAIVVFGKYSWWETFFFLLKGRPGQAFRRWHHNETRVRLAENMYQLVYYYSVRRLKNLLTPLQLIEKKPVGLFIPPSYLEPAMRKRPNLFHSLTRLEKNFTAPAVSSPFADHVFLLFKKHAQ
jgi:ubiquinone/menaquinone biosynthesis C-methylase UbiE